MQLFMWRPDIVRVAHFVMDCFDLLGAAPDARDGGYSDLHSKMRISPTHLKKLHQPWRLDICNHSLIHQPLRIHCADISCHVTHVAPSHH